MEAIRRRLEQHIEDLPMLPTVASQLMRLDPDVDDYFERVLELLEADPGFAIRLLSAANSAATAPVSQITSLRQALAWLGGQNTAQSAIALAVSHQFTPRHPEEQALWRHAVLVAGATRALNDELLGAHEIPPDDAYTAGLLHDIGHFVLFHEAPDSMLSLHEADWDTPERLLQAEQHFFGLTHCDLGWMACERFGLPPRVGNVVSAHHQPELAAPADQALASLVKLADFVMFPAVLPDTPGHEESALETIETDLLPRVPAGMTITAERLLDLIAGVAKAALPTFDKLGIR